MTAFFFVKVLYLSRMYKIRPRFRRIIEPDKEEFLAQLKTALKSDGATCRGNVVGKHCKLYLPKASQQFWSPELNLALEITEEGTLLRGFYGPRPTVWTMFVFFYSLVGFATIIISIVGLSQYSLGKPSPILWFVPFLILLFLSLYLSSYFGQKKAADQIDVLNKFVFDHTNIHIDDQQ